MEKCKYKDCRHDAEKDNDYCKYHKRMIEIEESTPEWLNEKINELKNRVSH